MLTFISFQLKTLRWMKVITRSHSIKPMAQRICPQVFSFENYDCIGFDLDHTLCRYKLDSLFTLIYKTLASFLIEKYEFPEELAEIRESDFSFSQKGLVLDKRRGNILKLDSRYRIVQATHGTRMLTKEDISKIYGQDSIWEKSLGIPHKLVLSNALDESFYVFKDFFVTPGAAICAKVIDMLDQRHGHTLKEYNFWDQYIEGILYMYERENFKNNSGKFFPAIKTNPERYYRPCSDEVKRWLSDISRNKVTFLLTSANYDVAQFSAEYCLGTDWRKYFSVIVTFAQKPSFFRGTKPFYMVGEDDTERDGVRLEDMNSNIIYSQGNFKDLLKVCANLSRSERPRIAYFGDSLLEDVYAASELASCDTIAIVEEMLAEGMENVDIHHNEREVIVSDFWGSFFSYKSEGKDLAENNISLWTHLLSKHSKITIPSLDCIVGLRMEDRIPCFSVDNPPFAGFFPGTPKALGPANAKTESSEPVSDSVVRKEKYAVHSGATTMI